MTETALLDKKDLFTQRPNEKCSQIIWATGEKCKEDAVGKAWLPFLKEWHPYCRRHLEAAKNLGFSIKLFSDTDVVHEWDKE